MDVLSISLDSSILDSNSESFQRQSRYAELTSSYNIVVKSGKGRSPIQGKGISVVPTNSLTRYNFLLDAYRIGADLCESKDIDVITTQSPFATGSVGLALSYRFDIPLHVSVVSDFPNEAWRRESIQNRIFEPLGRRILTHADAIRVDTEMGRWKAERIAGPDVPVTRVPVHMDLSQVLATPSADERKRFRSTLNLGKRPIVLFAGRFVYPKNLDQWMDVAERVLERTDEDPIFLLVGEGPKKDDLEECVRRENMEDSFRFLGWLDQQELGICYRISDVFLITSRYEGACRVIMEAGINQLPVVATPFAGAQDNIVDGVTGYVETSTDGLAEKTVELLIDDEKNEEFGNAAHDHLADSIRVEELVESYVASIRSAL